MMNVVPVAVMWQVLCSALRRRYWSARQDGFCVLRGPRLLGEMDRYVGDTVQGKCNDPGNYGWQRVTGEGHLPENPGTRKDFLEAGMRSRSPLRPVMTQTPLSQSKNTSSRRTPVTSNNDDK